MRGFMIAALLLAMTLAGCAGETDDTPDEGTDASQGPVDTTTSETATSTGTETEASTGAEPSDVNQTEDEKMVLEITVFTASTTNGTVPLNVTFDLDARSDHEGAEWRFVPGDAGDAVIGMVSDLPLALEYLYEIGGNFTAEFIVSAGDEQVKDSLDISVMVAEDAPPPETHFEYGEVAGCLTEAGECVGLVLGPNDGDGIDGWWQALDERYWGAALTSTMDGVGGDSDCFFLDEGLNVIGSGHNGGGPCEATVPEGAAWIFYFPWVEPALHMSLDFVLA